MLPNSFPVPDLFTPGGGEPSLRWGVAGTGWIAERFVAAVQRHTRQRISAVASRNPARAEHFAATHGISIPVEGFEQLIGRPDVDVIYIAAPQGEHYDMGMAAIAAGKQVLIEKPLAVSAHEARELAAAARAAGVLLMEGMWARYLPQASVLRRLLDDGVFGDVRAVMADHGQAIPFDPSHRLFRSEPGGGALIELGIYSVQFASMVLGSPDAISAIGAMTATGVDAFSTIVMNYSSGAQSTIFTTIESRTPSTAVISGTEATLALGDFFYSPTTLTLTGPTYDIPPLVWEDPTGLQLYDGLAWEATALAQYVGEGRTESPLHTLDEMITILSTIDEAKRQIQESITTRPKDAAHV